MSNEESLDAFATPRESEDNSSTASGTNRDTTTPARRTLVLHSSGSGNSTLTGDSSTSTASTSRTSCILLDATDDDDDSGDEFTGVSSGPRYMSRCPPTHGRVVADVEEDKKEEDDGGASDIEGEDGKEFEEAFVEAMEEKIQAATEDSNSVAHTEKKYEVLLSGNQIRLPSPPEAWVPPEPKTLKGEPSFADFDNPGSWSQFCRMLEKGLCYDCVL
jgi:hypothetical protein